LFLFGEESGNWTTTNGKLKLQFAPECTRSHWLKLKNNFPGVMPPDLPRVAPSSPVPGFPSVCDGGPEALLAGLCKCSDSAALWISA